MSTIFNLNDLFKQLGLPNTDQDIAEFISRQEPLTPDIKLEEASFWNKSQALFLFEAIAEDANWSYAVEELDVLLRQ